MYVKIFSSILDSSVWHESPTTVKVWLTLLCMADREGHVRAVERAVAQRAVVTPEEAREALRVLESPDLESQTQEYGGRRIERIEGGWLVLNYVKYRELRTEVQVREARRKRLQRTRKGGTSANVPGRVPAGDAEQNHDTEAEDASEAESPKPPIDNEIEPVGGGGGADVPGHVPHVPTIATATASAPAVAFSSGEELPRARETAEDLSAHFTAPEHLAAYQALRRSHRAPAALDATLRTIHAPITGGQGFDWLTIGAGILELLGNGEAFNAARLRGYCRTQQAHDARVREAAATYDAIASAGLSPALCWERLVRGGFTAPMQTRETLEQRAREAEWPGLSSEQVLALVLYLRPWELAEIKFAKERDDRLAAALRTFDRAPIEVAS